MSLPGGNAIHQQSSARPGNGEGAYSRTDTLPCMTRMIRL